MAKTLVYQMYPISWENNHGSAIACMTEHVKRIKNLNVDYIWLNPIYHSPRFDFGYDISDYYEIDTRFGTPEEFKELVKTAHKYGIGVLMELVLNHTSTEHTWFEDIPEYYCWSEKSHKGWKNFFNGEPAWKYDRARRQYYLHSFQQHQADLNWFPGGALNQDLVYEFHRIVDYWVNSYQIDGFHLGKIQYLNKDFSVKTLDEFHLCHTYQAAEIINAVFHGFENLFLTASLINTDGKDDIEYYTQDTPINFVMGNWAETQPWHHSKWQASRNLEILCSHPAYMTNLVSSDVSLSDMLSWMFSNNEGACLYQGQELGLESSNTPDACTPLPLAEYTRQEQDPDSRLNFVKEWIKDWRNPEKYYSSVFHLFREKKEAHPRAHSEEYYRNFFRTHTKKWSTACW